MKTRQQIDDETCHALRVLFDKVANNHSGDYPDKFNAGLWAVYQSGRSDERFAPDPTYDPRLGPYQPPMVYNQKTGKMVKPGDL